MGSFNIVARDSLGEIKQDFTRTRKKGEGSKVEIDKLKAKELEEKTK